jgi:hypothetical protein
MGDFNHPEINWINQNCKTSARHPSSEFLECTRESYLLQHITQPTHFRPGQTPNTLDLIFTNELHMLEELSYEPPLGKSHHSVLVFNLLCYSDYTDKPRETFIYPRGNYEAIRRELQEVEWNQVLEGKPTEECWSSIVATLKDVQHKYIPRTTRTAGPHKKRRPLWLNDNAMAKVKKKHAAWKRYMATRDGEAYREYCQSRNQAKHATRQAFRQFKRPILVVSTSTSGVKLVPGQE